VGGGVMNIYDVIVHIDDVGRSWSMRSS